MNERRLILRIVAMALMVYALAGLYTAGRALRRTEETVLQLEQELAAVRLENAELSRLRDDAQTEQGLMRLARERLGMVMPGEIVFYFVQDTQG